MARVTPLSTLGTGLHFYDESVGYQNVYLSILFSYLVSAKQFQENVLEFDV